MGEEVAAAHRRRPLADDDGWTLQSKGDDSEEVLRPPETRCARCGACETDPHAVLTNLRRIAHYLLRVVFHEN